MQSGHVPEVLEPEKLEKVLADWEQGRSLVYCDETMRRSQSPCSLKALRAPAAVLIGPEGGFTDEEKALLKSQAFVTRHLPRPPHHARRYGGRCGPDPCAGRGWATGASMIILMDGRSIFGLPEHAAPPKS